MAQQSALVAAVMNNLPWLAVLVLVLLAVLAVAAYVAVKRLNRPAEGEAGDTVTIPVPDIAAPLRLRRSFLHALQQIEAGVPGREARYRMPWVLMLGESGAGKSSALAGAGLPQQMKEFNDPAAGCTWWFFGGGVVIDVAGHYVLGPDGDAAERGWRNVLRQLVQHRPERPADAIVLAIPCTDLADPANRDAAYIAAKAERLYAALWAAQRTLGIRLPIYVVVTKCDVLPGFQPFAHALPQRLLDDMLGWSNPYPLETTFADTWVDEALESVHGDLFRLQLELFAERDEIVGADEVFQLPHDLRRMSAPLTQYLRLLFRASAYHETFFLRGIYFVGDMGMDQVARVAPAAALTVAAVPALAGAGGTAETAEPLPPWLRLPPIEVAEPPRMQHVFLRHLFEHKVFPEGGLARPAKGAALSQNRAVRAAQIGIGATAAFGAFALWSVTDSLTDLRRATVPVMQQLVQDLREIKSRREAASHASAEAIVNLLDERMALNLLRGMASVNFEWQVAAMPSYWVSSIPRDLWRAFSLSYSRIVISTTHGALTRRLHSITERGGRMAGTSAGNREDVLARLKRYTGELAEFEKYVEKYNGLRGNEDLQGLADLIQYLFNVTLPPQFFVSSYYYQKALGEAEFPRVNRAAHRPEATTMFRDVARRGMSEDGDYNQLVQFAREATELLRGALGRAGPGPVQDRGVRGASVPGVDVATLRQLGERLNGISEIAASPALAWLQGDGPPAAIRSLIADTASLQTLGPEFAEELAQLLRSEHARRQGELRQLTLPTLGPLFASEGGVLRIALAPPVRSLADRLERWFDQPFMMAGPRPRDLRTGGRFLWEARTLETAIGQAETYVLFAADELPGFPAPMQDIVRNLALDRVGVAMLDRVAQAQVPFAESGSRLRLDEELRQEISAFRDAAPVLQRLLQYFDQLQLAQGYDNLAEVAVNHAVTMLGQAEGLLNSEQLYLPQGGGFAWWTGGRPIAPDAFGLASQADLPRYLLAQRQRVVAIARDYAEPLAAFLTGATARGRGAGPLAAKWGGVIGALADYDANRPNNSLALLEKFIAGEMDEIDLPNCTTKLGQRAGTRGADFFALRLAQLRQGLLDQCRVLMDRQGNRAYGELAGAFNRNLSGRFPFVEPGARRVGDLDIAQLRQFFELYDQRAKPVREAIGARPQGNIASPAHDFLDRMEAARIFFAGLLGPEGPARSFVLDVEFRVNQNAEIGGREIIEWQIEIGDQRIQLGQGKKTLTWQYGQPIALALRWARNGPAGPLTDDAQPALSVDDRTALFIYEGPWALIDLLTRQALPAGEVATLADNRPHTLKFVVPTQANPGVAVRPGPRLASRVYLRVAVKTVARSEGKPDAETALVMPSFPARAPDLR
jgi:type VI secretion system protein ImpL